jgi:cytochrome c peroxidase
MLSPTRHLIPTLIALLALFPAVPALSQETMPQSHARDEPITPIPASPVVDSVRVALGERLFHDTRLSHDNTRSCSTCHDTRTNGASPTRFDSTPDGALLALNTPSVFNSALSFRLNWEGNLRTFEQESERILCNPKIMGSSDDEALGKLRADSSMVAEFRRAYGHDPDRASLLDALAVYQRSLVTPGSRFDRWLAGDSSAITRDELAGYELFKSLGCISCHQGVNVGGNLYERHGIFHPLASPDPEIVRVPSLRNVATTPPYFHDGSASTLSQAVKEMGFAQLDRTLTDPQIGSVVGFLETLTGTYRGEPVRPPGEDSQEVLP